VAHKQPDVKDSQSGARDARKTPGKGVKLPPMGAKRKMAPKKRPA